MKTTIIAALVVLLAGCAAQRPAERGPDPDTRTFVNEPKAASAQSPVKDGDTRSGDIASADEQDTYDIDLGDAEEFELVDVQGEVDFKIATAEESGANQKGNGLPGPHQFGVTAPGRHKLVVSGHEGRQGKYGFRLVTLKKREFASKAGEIKGTLDVPGRVDVHTFELASVEIEDGKPCEDVQLGFSSESAEDETKTYTPHYVCWNPKHEGENGRTQIVIWSESGKTGDYSFTVRAR
ncbi:hypothetical protein [Lentzea flava]|uniref:Lipoprotein n=1 Tax=Lentzea flava TaxID=103732 RepID=A0ABQ2VDG6_9PSEU|nr:hypothetical protein [Lentzea flava]MCP2204472.1 hypothetical protein [Lentzea flava]GGU78334.1 hypothetical protein GCM10010178_81700 [Lentzea flava]